MSTREDRIAEILADCQERRDKGEVVDHDQLLREHPDLAEELAQYLALSRRLDVESQPAAVGNYEIRRELGRGGMGVVYEALDVTLQRPVALKLLHASLLNSSQAIARFRQEARAAGQQRHRNIVPVREMGRDHGVWYIAMELVDGEPLNRVLDGLAGRSEPVMELPKGEGYFTHVAQLFAGVADALEVVHKTGVVHRDIKPGNLILSRDGTLMIIDFGLARLGAGTSMTATGRLLGTPEYMSPEQARAAGAGIDHRTDVYSLGATLYEILTLRPAFSGRSVPQICSAIAAGTPTPPRRIDGSVPRDLETIVLHAMAKAPDKRYATAGLMAEDLRRFVEGRPAQAPRQWAVALFARRHWAVLLALLALATVAAALLLNRGQGSADPPPRNDPPAMSSEQLRHKALSMETKGDLEGALETIERSCETSPTYPAHVARARILMELGRFEAMLAACRESIARFPRPTGLNRYELVALRALGRHDEARTIAQRQATEIEKTRFARAQLAYMYAVLGRGQEARDLLKNVRKQRPYQDSSTAAVLGDRELTKQLLESAVAKGEAIPKGARVEPDLDVWKDDAGIQALLDKLRAN